MARPWRLRHKLVFGLALVIASIALLIGGAALGLTSYVEAERLADHKMHQIRVIIILRDHIHYMATYTPVNRPEEAAKIPSKSNEPAVWPGSANARAEEQKQILIQLGYAEKAVAYYRETLKTTEPFRGSDPDEGEGERHALGRIEHSLAALRKAVTARGASVSTTGDSRLIDDPPVRAAHSELLKESTELFTLLGTDIKYSFTQADSNRKRGTVIALTATVIAVILIMTLLYYFKVWVFSPIRQLQAGVQRVHAGDFDSPIHIGSRDELDELANEFNTMTARLRDVYADLARQVNERSRQLVRSERMVSVGFLAAGVAHEINNPLASIAFCSEALERRVDEVSKRLTPGDAEVLAKYLRVIQQEAFRCKQITQKLLDFSRSGEGRRESTDLGRLIQDVIDVARPLPNCRGKSIEFNPVYVVAAVNPPDMKSVVLNLVVNALDSMDEGGVLSIAAARQGEFVELLFQDTGCGMTPEVLQNLFEPFYTRKRTGNGTGLGLSISHQIIDQHGGTVAVTSDGPGHGSTFVVRLPVQAVVKRPAATDEPDILPLRPLQQKVA
ncbi:sensor histidine kinase [Limnoglobus roseus]|uniref:histidine kinase n=1 Tax=Limnoglobus roseus TaxID=2598579 RepID=A0A5C1AHH7_9BACT|nr:HAMP domain-containing sensor histidine kinase [Limnoglobus roseus]QEL16584.1 sensor histidine kinase [Limnoglobus roseus]